MSTRGWETQGRGGAGGGSHKVTCGAGSDRRSHAGAARPPPRYPGGPRLLMRGGDDVRLYQVSRWASVLDSFSPQLATILRPALRSLPLARAHHTMADVYSYSLQTSKGELKLADYKDKDILIVNVASRCGLTPQYKDLQALSEKYAGKLEVVGQPCNQVRSSGDAADPSSRRRSRGPTTRSSSSARPTMGSRSPLRARATSTARTRRRCTSTSRATRSRPSRTLTGFARKGLNVADRRTFPSSSSGPEARSPGSPRARPRWPTSRPRSKSGAVGSCGSRLGR